MIQQIELKMTNKYGLQKKYEQALERAKVINPGTADYEVAVKIFPELKESEDEEIRKEIIQSIQNNMCVIHKDKCIVWLEKQGEQKTADKKYTFNAIPRLLDMIQPTDRAKAYCQKLIDSLIQEGYGADAKIVGEYLKQMNGEKVAMATMDEQKPSENKGMNLVEEEMTPFQKKVFFIIDTAIEEEQGLKQVCDELLSLAHDEIIQKPAWSDEDETGFCNTLWAINQAHAIAKNESDMGACWSAENWLKCFRERMKNNKQ